MSRASSPSQQLLPTAKASSWVKQQLDQLREAAEEQQRKLQHVQQQQQREEHAHQLRRQEAAAMHTAIAQRHQHQPQQQQDVWQKQQQERGAYGVPHAGVAQSQWQQQQQGWVQAPESPTSARYPQGATLANSYATGALPETPLNTGYFMSDMPTSPQQYMCDTPQITSPATAAAGLSRCYPTGNETASYNLLSSRASSPVHFQRWDTQPLAAAAAAGSLQGGARAAAPRPGVTGVTGVTGATAGGYQGVTSCFSFNPEATAAAARTGTVYFTQPLSPQQQQQQQQSFVPQHLQYQLQQHCFGQQQQQQYFGQQQQQQQGIPIGSPDGIAYVTTRNPTDHECSIKKANACTPTTPTTSSSSSSTARGRIIAEYQHDLSHVLPGVGVTVRVREPLVPGLFSQNPSSINPEGLREGAGGPMRGVVEDYGQYTQGAGSTLGGYSMSCFNPLFGEPCGGLEGPVHR